MILDLNQRWSRAALWSFSTSRGARWLVFGVHMIDLHGELRNEHIIPVVRAPKLESSWDWELPSLSRWTQAVVPTTPPKSEWASFLKVLVGPIVWNVLLQNRKRRTYICDLSAIQYRRWCSRRHLLNWMDFLDRLDVKITQQPEKTRTHQQMFSGTNRSICFPGLVASCCYHQGWFRKDEPKSSSEPLQITKASTPRALLRVCLVAEQL